MIKLFLFIFQFYIYLAFFILDTFNKGRPLPDLRKLSVLNIPVRYQFFIHLSIFLQRTQGIFLPFAFLLATILNVENF